MLLNCKTAREAIHSAGLDWKVALKDLFFGEKADPRLYPDSKAIVRADTNDVLGIVGARYVPIQNEEVFSFLDSFIDTDEAKYKSAQQYKGGRVLSVDLTLSRESIHTVRVGDDIETIIRVITSHDGSEKLQAQLMMLRLVCLNGATRAQASFGFSVKHTESARVVLANGYDLIQVARTFGAEFAERAREMNALTLSRDALTHYVKCVLGIEKEKEEDIPTRTANKVRDITALAIRGKGNTGRSLWDAYNGVTEYADHHISVKGTNDRLTSSVFGAGRTLKDRAYEVAGTFLKA